MFIGAPSVLVVLWLMLASVGVGFGIGRKIPWWLSGLICVLATGATAFNTSTAHDYIRTTRELLATHVRARGDALEPRARAGSRGSALALGAGAVSALNPLDKLDQ